MWTGFNKFAPPILINETFLDALGLLDFSQTGCDPVLSVLLYPHTLSSVRKKSCISILAQNELLLQANGHQVKAPNVDIFIEQGLFLKLSLTPVVILFFLCAGNSIHE